MIKQRPTKIPAIVHVDLLRKSAVRLTPNTVPMEAPPNEPANPPPLLDCIKTTIISNMLITNSTVTSTPNMFVPSRNDKYCIQDMNIFSELQEINFCWYSKAV